jgi:hypothetical protein
MVRARRKHSEAPSRRREFDVMVVTPSQFIPNESKPRPRRATILESGGTCGEVTECFPAYTCRPVAPIFTDHGIYAMTMSDDSMEIRNHDAVAAG